MLKRLIIILFAPLTLFTSCILIQSGIDQITDLVPRDSDVPGWNRTGEVMTFQDDNVEGYKNEYSGLGIEKIAVCRYANFADPRQIITVEVIRFNSILNSFSFFSGIKGFGDDTKCSEEEFSSEGTMVFRQGEYIIYVYTANPDLNSKKEMKIFTDVVNAYIGKNFIQDKLPPVSSILKRSGAPCVLYSRKSLAHLRGINRIYYAGITEGEKKYFVFLSDRESGYNSMNIFQKMISKKYIIIKADNTQSAFIKDENSKYTFISVYDRWIYGCWGISEINDGKNVLVNIRNVIESYSKTSQ